MQMEAHKQKIERIIFRVLNNDLKKNLDFESYISQKIRYNRRDWTVGQFLYKYCFDEWQPFAYYARDHFDSLNGREKELAEKIKQVMEGGLTKPLNAYRFAESEKNLGFWPAKRHAFYQNLFVGKRSVAGNPCYWHPVAQCQTAFVEYKLGQIGLTEKQILDLMIHCENEREIDEKKAIHHMPPEFIHNTVLPPEEMKNGKIDLFVRSDDQFLNFQKLAFIGEPGCFHAGLPIQATSFAAWPRFNPDVMVFLMDRAEAKRQISDSYNYRVDMAQKKDFRPCVPLWGGKPLEWVSAKPLRYTDVRKETLRDLIKQGKKFYFVTDPEAWKQHMEKAIVFSQKEAQVYLENLVKRHPDKVFQLDQHFLDEYEKEFPIHEAERKKRRADRIKGISLKQERFPLPHREAER